LQEFVKALAAFALCSAMGQCFIYYTIAEFSPLLLATVTTTRKIFSTLVSVFRDPSACRSPNSFENLNQKALKLPSTLSFSIPALTLKLADPSLLFLSVADNRLNEMQWAGCLLVFAGIIGEQVSSRQALHAPAPRLSSVWTISLVDC
jgi:drug/metabolite transporter (DMT)-like permease